MNILTYGQLNRTVNPTGVGKHLTNMALQLRTFESVRSTLLCAYDQLDPRGNIPVDTPLAGSPVISLPWRQRWLEASWLLLNSPNADHWLGQPDWVYTPSEVPIPLKTIRLAVTCHDINWLEPDVPWAGDFRALLQRGKWSWRLKRINDTADRIITVSEFTRSRLVALGGFEYRRIVVVGNGVEEIFFRTGDQDRSPQRIPYLLVVGGINERKNGGAILKVARMLQRQRSDLELVISGRIDRFFASQDLPSNIRQIGYVQTSELARLMRNCVALLFPSRYEGFGIPAAEAMATGAPVIVSNWGALPEVVGPAGLVVPNADVEQIVHWSLLLRDDEDLRMRLEAAGKARAVEFTWRKCAERLVSALNAV